MSASTRRRTRRAKRILQQAIPHVGPDVVVLAPGVSGDGYLATSLPLATSQDIERVLVLAQEATKKLRAWHRQRVRIERAVEAEA